VAHSQAVVLLSRCLLLDPAHPVEYLDGGVDRVGLDEAGNAYARAAHGRVLEAVAWLVEEAGEGRVKARHAVPTQALCLLWCANRQPVEGSQTRRARE
jgi:hypothetical protein